MKSQWVPRKDNTDGIGSSAAFAAPSPNEPQQDENTAVVSVTPHFPNLKILAQNQSKQLNRMLHFFKIQL